MQPTLFPVRSRRRDQADRLRVELRIIENLRASMRDCTEPDCWACRMTLLDVDSHLRKALR